jgi:hypothetical protein
MSGRRSEAANSTTVNHRTGIGMISEGGGKGAVFIDGKVIMTST